MIPTQDYEYLNRNVFPTPIKPQDLGSNQDEELEIWCKVKLPTSKNSFTLSSASVFLSKRVSKVAGWNAKIAQEESNVGRSIVELGTRVRIWLVLIIHGFKF